MNLARESINASPDGNEYKIGFTEAGVEGILSTWEGGYRQGRLGRTM